MDTVDYSKREIDEHFKDLGTKLDANTAITRALDTKVGIQNGRTAKLEGTVKGMAMAGSVAIFLIGIIMSLVVYSFNLSQEVLKNSILIELQK